VFVYVPETKWVKNSNIHFNSKVLNQAKKSTKNQNKNACHLIPDSISFLQKERGKKRERERDTFEKSAFAQSKHVFGQLICLASLFKVVMKHFEHFKNSIKY